VVLFSKSYCSFSSKVKAVLAELDVQPVHCLELDTLPEGEGLALQLELSVLTKADGVPQVPAYHTNASSRQSSLLS
jgi:hypothetical protein